MTGLRVLITNNTLAGREGSELYVRDIATALLARGHCPFAYSTLLGEVAAEIRAATIPVVDDLETLSTAPDVIHGHHHLDVMTALLHFPGVPAVCFCHGWLPWEEAAPRFPRIRRYVAVSLACRDRLVFEHGVPEDRVSVVLNFVDLDRFTPRAPLPARPARALVFNNRATEENLIGAARAACASHDIALDVIGHRAGRSSANPEVVLKDYDLVFAAGRSALEALAVGAAVVLCHAEGAGPLVTTAELDRLRALNLGLRATRQPVRADVLSREIARYDPSDATEVSLRVRATAGREVVVDQLVALYREAIAEQSRAAESDAALEVQAAARYLRWIAPALKERFQATTERNRLQDERDNLAAERDRLQAECDRLRSDLETHSRASTPGPRTRLPRIPRLKLPF